jgi:hypothetical protein
LIDDLPHAQREAFPVATGRRPERGGNCRGDWVNRETAKSRLRYALAKLRQGCD